MVVILDNNEDELERCAEVEGVVTFHCDVTNTDQVEDVFEAISKEYSIIDVNVNCAGIAPAARMLGRDGPQPLADFEKVIDINLTGTYNVMRIVSSYMQENDADGLDGERGVIINTASVAAFEGQIGQAAYSASKGGVAAMTLPIAREMARWGVRVMTIAPGVIETPMMAEMPEKVQKSLASAVPFPPRLGRASEYAKLVEHIIQNGYLNGSVIRLDGALRMS